MKPKRETPTHRAAFEFYWALGRDRNHAKVAVQFGVSETSVQNWSSAFGWKEKLVERDRVVGDMVSEQVKAAEGEARERMLALCRAVMIRFAQLLEAGKVRVEPDGFVRVAQLELLLRGQPTSREELNVRSKPGAWNAERRAIAEFILRTVNATDRNRPLLDSLRRSLGPAGGVQSVRGVQPGGSGASGRADPDPSKVRSGASGTAPITPADPPAAQASKGL